jgi:superfamily II DNA or RNA helicase
MCLENKAITLAMCTGSGKSRVSIMACKELNPKKICLIVPTVRLRDNNWKDEFIKWESKIIYEKIDRYCYASIAKIEKKEYDLVICDEIHNITEKSINFFLNNKIDRVIGLTATPPEDEVKKQLIDSIAPIGFVYTLSEGVKDGVVSPYEIQVIESRLDNKNKNVKAGKSPNFYYITELKKYENLNNLINVLNYKGQDATWAVMARMRFLYNLKSKTDMGKYVLNNIIDPELRTLIFCGSILQAETLCKDTFHSKSGDDSLNKFINKEINRLSCVKSLNEGQNLPEIDAALIIQLNSKKKDLVQRVKLCAAA